MFVFDPSAHLRGLLPRRPRLRDVKRFARVLGARLGAGASRPLFVVGCQRSGTTMLLRVLGRSPECRVFHEGNREAFDGDFRLRERSAIRSLIARSPAPVVAFKPLQDSQRTDRLLEAHEGSRAVWLYRHYRGAAGSALHEWGDSHRGMMLGIARGRCEEPGQRAVEERLSDRARDVIGTFAGDGLSAEDGCLLHWYVRNLLCLEFADDPRMMVASYERLVSEPLERFRRVFEFAGCRFDPGYVRDVTDDRLGAYGDLRFDPALEELARELEGELDARLDDGTAGPSG